MSANFLTCFSGAEDSDDRNFRLLVNLRRLDIVAKYGVELRGRSLVVVYAVQADPEWVHDCQWIDSGGRRMPSVGEGILSKMKSKAWMKDGYCFRL